MNSKRKTEENDVALVANVSEEATPKRIKCEEQTNGTEIIGAKGQESIDNKLLDMIIADIQPLSIVENRGFIEFCKALNASYTLPNRVSVSAALQAKFLETLDTTKLILNTAKVITLTIDSWSYSTEVRFIGVTGHFVDEHFNIKSKVLQATFFDNAVCDLYDIYIAQHLERVVQQWNIQSKIFVTISDDIINVKKAIVKRNWKHFECLAYAVNLIANDGLKHAGPLLNQIKKIVAMVNLSSSTENCFDSLQRQKGKTPKKLIQCVSTCWISVFNMVERVLELKEEIKTFMTTFKLKLMPDFDKLEQLIKIFTPLKSLTKTMIEERYVTLSSLIVITNELTKIYTHLSDNPLSSESVESRQIIEALNQGIEIRFKDLENNDILLISSFLDPRYKNVGFSNEDVEQKARNLVTNLLTNLIDARNTEPSTSIAKSPASSSIEDSFEPEGDECPFWGNFDKRNPSSESFDKYGMTKAEREIEEYLTVRLLNRKSDPLHWWKVNAYNFPNLSKLVKENFGPVCMSVSRKHLTVKAGQLLRDKLERLTTNEVNKVMFLKINSEIS